MISVFIVDDHPVVVEGLKSVIEKLPGHQVTGTAFNAVDAVNMLKTVAVDVLLLDINLPDISGIDLCKKVRKTFPDIKVLGISTFNERSYISRMIGNGASGYLIKSASPDEIAEAIASVMQGKWYMSLDTEHLLRPSSVVSPGNMPARTKGDRSTQREEGMTNNRSQKI